MKKLLLLFVLLVVLFFFFSKKNVNNDTVNPQPMVEEVIKNPTPIVDPNSQTQLTLQETVVEGLDTPWAIAFLPDGGMLVTERNGAVRLVNKEGRLESDPIIRLKNAKEISEGGLLGVVLHPDFAANNYVYFYYTFSSNEDNTLNRVVRLKFANNQFGTEEVIVDNIPGNSNHNGGRIKFGPDKNLYITTGDAQEPSLAQSTSSTAGKILRTTDLGKSVSGNSFNNLVYSYGHRNPQGIAWDKDGRLWSTEHGRSGIQSGLDELNLIETGKNYGWPEIEGNKSGEGMVSPKVNSGNTTWAPAGAAFIGDRLFFAGLRGQTLYEAVIKGNEVSIKEHFQGQFGRIREVIKGPDNMLYITTSNRDGRGIPKSEDDKIIRINPSLL